MIFRVFLKFNQKPFKNQDLKEHKLLTISVLILTKDQLKKGLRDAQIERDILKKAISIFSRNDGKYSNS